MDEQRINRAGGLPRFRFSLKLLLGIVTAVSLRASSYLAGRHNGKERGYQQGVAERVAQWLTRYYDLRQQFDDFSKVREARDQKAWDEATARYIQNRLNAERRDVERETN
jgi:hypothetical protein